MQVLCWELHAILGVLMQCSLFCFVVIGVHCTETLNPLLLNLKEMYIVVHYFAENRHTQHEPQL